MNLWANTTKEDSDEKPGYWRDYEDVQLQELFYNSRWEVVI